MTEHSLFPGKIINGKYRLTAELGAGGMGTVWGAEQLNLDAPVAIKVVTEEQIGNEVALARFLREAKASAQLRSPHIVQVFDHGCSDGFTYIVMERLQGESLRERLRSAAPMSPATTATVLTHVGRAMTRAHASGIVHRDLKPSNIFLVENDDDFVAKVLDFGVAKSLHLQLDDDDSPKTRTGSMMGTPYYMSPEQAEGTSTLDHRSDLWAMGVIAFECLTGELPFVGDTIGDLVLKICVRPLPIPSRVGPVPLGFDAWFATAMARDKMQRFTSAKELVRALRAILLPDSGKLSLTDNIGKKAEAGSSAPDSSLSTRTAADDDATAFDVEGATVRGDETVSPPGEKLAAEMKSHRSLDAAIVDSQRTTVADEPPPENKPVMKLVAIPLLVGALLALWFYGPRASHQDAAAERVPASSPTTPSAVVPPGALASAPTPSPATATAQARGSASAAEAPSSSVSAALPAKSRPGSSNIRPPVRGSSLAPPASERPAASETPPPAGSETPPPVVPSVVPTSPTEKPENPLGI